MESMLEYFYNEMNGKLTKLQISKVIEMFTSVSTIVRYDDMESNIREFLKSEVLKNDLRILIHQSNKEMKKLSQNQHNLLNEIIIQKRNDGDLFRYLKTFQKKDLDTLRRLVDIEVEYKIVDREFTNNSKFQKGGRSYGLMDGKNDVTTYV